MFQTKDARITNHSNKKKKNISHMSILRYKRHGDAEYMYVYTCRQKLLQTNNCWLSAGSEKGLNSQHSIRPFFLQKKKKQSQLTQLW
jgi:hypothetical protein